MSDSTTPEQNRPNERERVVRPINLGEEVPLFEDESVQVLQSPSARDLGVPHVFHSKAELKITDSLVIPIGINADASLSEVSHTITPFHPENGYLIDQRDFDYDERMKKIKEMGSRFKEQIDIKKDPLWVRIDSSYFALNETGLNIKSDIAFFRFPPEMLMLLKKLRVQLVFPGSEGTEKPGDPNYRPELGFEGRIWDTSLGLGQISFKDFYPTDTGSLPADDSALSLVRGIQEGFTLFVPTNLDLLKKVKIKFFLTEPEEEQPLEVQPEPQTPSTSSGGFIRSRKDR